MEKASAKNIQNYLEAINTFNSTPEFGTTRILFTPPEVESRKYIKGEMEKLGLAVHEDAIGNIFAVAEGTEPDLPPVWTGSHIDTVPNAGMFDGMSGIVAGLEAIRLIKAAGLTHRRSIVVVVYTSEEPTRFKLGCLGSRAMAGRLSLADAEKLTDDDGKTLASVLAELGYNLKDFSKIPVRKGEVYRAVELHIDQTGVLERAKKTIGLVKTICAPSVYTAEVKGKQGHAGGASMADRRDAYMAAAEMAVAFERLGRESTSEYSTTTIGKVEVVPNGANVIPGLVRFSVDVRDCDFAKKEELTTKMKEEFTAIAERRGVELTLIEHNNDHPMPCDKAIIAQMASYCEHEGIPYMETLSGAFHDSMLVGEFTPVAMIFVPSKDGISHSPDEWTDFADIATGTDVLADTLLKLANE